MGYPSVFPTGVTVYNPERAWSGYYRLGGIPLSGGVAILRPPRDGRMAFVKSPDGHSVELLQAGAALEPAEPWRSMPNEGSW